MLQYLVKLFTMARILERGITLIQPHSGNKSDKKDHWLFCFLSFVFEQKMVRKLKEIVK